MIIHLQPRPSKQEPGQALVHVILDMFADGRPISGQCGLHVRPEQLQEFVDRIDPDYWNGDVYIPGMPIDLKHIRIVES